MLEPLKRTRVSDNVVEALARMIIRGEYAPGRKLPTERELSEKFDINRTSLREAVRYLENIGLLRVRQGDGVYVEDYREKATLDLVNLAISTGSLDREWLLAIEEVRRIFAVKMVELAAERIDEETLDELERIVSDFPAEPTPELLSGDWEFRFYHEVAKGTGNPLFVYMLNTIKDLFGQLRWLYCRIDASFDPGGLLREIVEAIRAGDGEKAATILDARMTRESELISELMAEPDMVLSRVTRGGLPA